MALNFVYIFINCKCKNNNSISRNYEFTKNIKKRSEMRKFTFYIQVRKLYIFTGVEKMAMHKNKV